MRNYTVLQSVFTYVKQYYDAIGFIILITSMGLSFPAFEVGLTAFPVLFLAAMRFDIAGVLILSYVFLTSTEWKPTTFGDYFTIGAGGLITFAIATAFWGIGQEMTTSTLSGLMASFVPILTAGFSWLLIPEDRLSPIGVFGLLVGFSGALLIMIPENSLTFGPGIVGKVMMLVGVTASALGGVLIRWAEPSLPAVSQTGWAIVIGAIMLHAASFLVENPLVDSTVTPAGIFAVFFLGVVTSAIGRGIFFWLLGRRSAIEISITSYVSPVISAIAGWMLFGDEISVSMVLGFLIVVVGFAMMKRNALEKEFYRLENAL